MSLYNTLVEQFKKDQKYINENGELKKWVIIQRAQNFDKELLDLLIQNDVLKKEFFVNIQGILIFKQNLFIDFLVQKNYFNNSYTKYKNKIGLTIDGMYLKQRNEIALIWPFKDCILEGGQTKEEQSRKEIFFNEILAQDEITQLLEPKVLTNAKRFDKDGEKLVDQFNRNEEGTITDNLIIKGNNLLALHSIKKEFAGKVKLIYIDPPYNTGNDEFKYNDNFNRSTWLTFMKNRFEVAKELLSNDGSIFVQCDDNEQAYLKVLMDEIFGSDNYRETIVVKTSTPSGVNAINVKRGERLFKVKEYILFYSKTPTFRFYPIYIKSNFNYNYRYEVIKKKQGYIIKDLKLLFSNKKELEAYALKNYDRIYSLEKNNKKAGDKIKIEIEKSKNNKEVIEYINSKGQLILIYNGGVLVPLKERIIIDDNQVSFGTLISDLWDDEIFQTNKTEGGVSLPGGKKPEKLIKRILELTTQENDLVLDYHLGSGTTAAVAHKMKRRYIGIEQLDYGENDSIVRLNNVIQGDQTGISKNVKWNGGGSFISFELKKYNEYFIDKILKAKNISELEQIYYEIKKKAFIKYNVDIIKLNEELDLFKTLSFLDQKKLLCELLDKNQLYINLSSLMDADYCISEYDKNITINFYNVYKI